MGRNKGLASFSANFEGQMAAPIDARMIVDNKADLILPATWQANDGLPYTYVGMIVCVHSDATSANNGLYRLTAADYTVAGNWATVGGMSAGTAAGEMVFWDGTAWVHTETSEMMWDDTNKSLLFGTPAITSGIEAGLSTVEASGFELLFYDASQDWWISNNAYYSPGMWKKKYLSESMYQTMNNGEFSLWNSESGAAQSNIEAGSNPWVKRFTVNSTDVTVNQGVLTITPVGGSIATLRTNDADARMDFVATRSTGTNRAFVWLDSSAAIKASIIDDGYMAVGSVAPNMTFEVNRNSANTYAKPSIGAYDYASGSWVYMLADSDPAIIWKSTGSLRLGLSSALGSGWSERMRIGTSAVYMYVKPTVNAAVGTSGEIATMTNDISPGTNVNLGMYINFRYNDGNSNCDGNEDGIGGMTFQGTYTSGALYNPISAKICARPTESFNITSAGTCLRFFTTDNGTTALDLRTIIHHNGTLQNLGNVLITPAGQSTWSSGTARLSLGTEATGGLFLKTTYGGNAEIQNYHGLNIHAGYGGGGSTVSFYNNTTLTATITAGGHITAVGTATATDHLWTTSSGSLPLNNDLNQNRVAGFFRVSSATTGRPSYALTYGAVMEMNHISNTRAQFYVDAQPGRTRAWIRSTADWVSNTTNWQPWYNLLSGDGGWAYYFQSTSVPASTSYKLYNISGTLYWNGTALATGGAGDVTAGAALTNNYIVRGDGGAKGIQTSLVNLTDIGSIYCPATLGVGNRDSGFAKVGRSLEIETCSTLGHSSFDTHTCLRIYGDLNGGWSANRAVFQVANTSTGSWGAYQTVLTLNGATSTFSCYVSASAFYSTLAATATTPTHYYVGYDNYIRKCTAANMEVHMKGMGFMNTDSAVLGDLPYCYLGGYDLFMTNNKANFGTTGMRGVVLGINSADLMSTTHTYAVVIGHHSNAGQYSVGIGAEADCMNVGAVGVGYNATTSGPYSVAIGGNTVADNYGVAIGYSTYTFGSYGIAIGHNTSARADNVICIGHGVADATIANQISLGNTSHTTFRCLAAYADAADTSLPNMFVNVYGKIRRDTNPSSSLRYKEDIEDMGDTSWLYELRPITYRFQEWFCKNTVNKWGLIAEEAEEVAPDLVLKVDWDDLDPKAKVKNPELEGEKAIPDAINYPKLIIPMLAEMKKLRTRIEELEGQ